MNEQVTSYIEGLNIWKTEAEQLRDILLSTSLTEEWKWRAPCYVYKKKNVAIIGVFQAHLSLSFFKGALLKDSKKLLEKPGENSQASRQFSFTNRNEIVSQKSYILDYIAEAIELEKSGQKIDFSAKKNLELPEELLKAFELHDGLKASFEALTPGRQRGYVLYFTGAKQSKSRAGRIEKYIPRILNFKGFHDCVCGHTKKPPQCDGSHKYL